MSVFLELGGREDGLGCYELGVVFPVFWELDEGGGGFLFFGFSIRKI